MISGERIQELCDVYCGHQSDFDRNPRIRSQTHKHMRLNEIPYPWDNPPLLFCYSHCVKEFMGILPRIKNSFTLISHNEDTNIEDSYLPLLEHPKLLFWHAQNVLFHHPKLGSLPIGIANTMWPHGNQTILKNVLTRLPAKNKLVYFNFSIGTNARERTPCYEKLKEKLPWIPSTDFQTYLETLSTHKYAISPPGNGIDCHRIWECIYLGVIPILLRSVFTEKLNAKFPCILLDRWEDLHLDTLEQLYIPPSYTVSFDTLRECVHLGKDFFAPN